MDLNMDTPYPGCTDRKLKMQKKAREAKGRAAARVAAPIVESA